MIFTVILYHMYYTKTYFSFNVIFNMFFILLFILFTCVSYSINSIKQKSLGYSTLDKFSLFLFLKSFISN